MKINEENKFIDDINIWVDCSLLKKGLENEKN